MQTPFYRGHRDLGLMMFSGVFNYAMVGLMIQSAYVTLSQVNISSWLEVQDQYEQQILQTYDRFFALDSIIMDTQIANAQSNLRYLIKSQPVSGPFSNQQVTDRVSGMLRDVFPSKQWFVVVYNGEMSSHFSSHVCLPDQCISSINYMNRYNVLAVGIDSITSPPNTKLLVSAGWKTLLNSVPLTDAFTQIYTISQAYCFTALLSLVGDHSATFSLPNNQYYQLVQLNKGSNAFLAFATTKDSCSY